MGQERILIAEDEPRVAQALSRALSLPNGGNYLVETYESGEAALARLGETHFDLLITDLRMPGMNGLELLTKCRETSPDTRSILITAFGSSETEEEARQLGVDAYLTKPFSMRSLVQTVQTTLTAKPRQTTPKARTAARLEETFSIDRRLTRLRKETDAHGVFLFDESGRVLAKSGARTALDFEIDAFLSMLGKAMSASSEVSNLLGEPEAFDLHYHEGKKYETCATRVSDGLFLSLLLDRQTSTSRVGMIWLYLRRAARDLALRSMDNESEHSTQQYTPPPVKWPVAEAHVVAPSAEDLNSVISYEQAKALGLVDFETTGGMPGR